MIGRKEIAIWLVVLAALLAGTAFAAVPSSSASSSSSGCTISAFAGEISPWYCSQLNQAVASVWYEWAPVVFIAVLLSFSISALIFLTGVAMRSEKLRNFGIGELYETVATLLIAAFFLLLSAILFGILPFPITGPLNPYTTSLTYIGHVINSTQTLITSMYNPIMIDSMYASISLGVCVGKSTEANGCEGNTQSASGVSGSGVATRLAGGLAQNVFNKLAPAIAQFFLIPANAVMGLLSDGLLALYAEFYFILFFMYISIPVLLVPGVVLRAIFPLRAVGGMMIAAAFSFFLVMPVLFSVAYILTSPGLVYQLNQQAALISANGQGTSAQTNADSASSVLAQEVQGVQSEMGGYFLSVLFYPALILALSYTTMTIIADFIGGASQMSSKLRLI